MTTKVIIEHGTPGYTKSAQVTVVDDDGFVVQSIAVVTIAAGEKKEFYIHSGNNLLIKEV